MKSKTNNDEKWMRRAMELARRAAGIASPNPMTGAVIVRGGRVLGEGFHTYEGRDHAEIVALKRAGAAARGATLYVNLEPCSHTGRTAPCVDAIIAAGIRRVVAATRDPNPKVAGRGFRKLRAAGISVESGVCEEDARRMHEGFARWITSGLPLVTMKSGMTLDGQLAMRSGEARRASATWITSAESRAEVHRMRHASDALLTGIGTVLADDPLMTDRSGLPRRRPLLRVILDSRLRLPVKSKIVKTAARDVLVITLMDANHARARRLREAGVDVVSVRSRGGRIDLRAVARELGKREILNVIVEAGSEVNGAALAAGIVDKIVLFIAPVIAGSQDVPVARGVRAPLATLSDVSVRRFGPDICIEGYLRKVAAK
jgi:diaminohydroxyphosphoribosylaminopyrimidine deaminase / 5-amino-6-(5-phosphoribosylamino)uracil reductase